MHISEAITKTMTATQEPPTPARAANTLASANPFEPQFETFGERPLCNMLDAANSFVEDIRTGKKPRWVSFLGTSGAGKTYLARQIMRWIQRTPLFTARVPEGGDIIYPGGFYSWRRTADEILGGDYSRVHDLCRETFVVLDDIGAEYKDKAGIVKAKLDRIIDERVGKWTVITCNLSLQQISEQMDTRIASRMLRNGSVVVDVDVEDYGLRAIKQAAGMKG